MYDLNESQLHKRIERGYKLDCLNGRAHFLNHRGEAIDKKHHDEIMAVIAKATNSRILKYHGKKIRFEPKRKSDTLMLFFTDLLSGADVVVFLNVSMKRRKNIDEHKAGELLPNGQFYVERKSTLAKLFTRLKLKNDKPTRYGISNLKNIYLTGEVEFTKHGLRVRQKETLNGFNISSEELLNILVDNLGTNDAQSKHNTSTKSAHNDSPENLTKPNFQANQSTVSDNYGLRLKGNGNKDSSITYPYGPSKEEIDRSFRDDFFKTD